MPSVYGETSHVANNQDSMGQAMGDANPILGHGALPRPRSASDAGVVIDRQRERQLVGSLTNSHKFKGGGLVKKVGALGLGRFKLCYSAKWHRAD